ncbi:MAG: type II toxin-antitoxin system prevent-host-death family antitoxin [Deltaproteobacteria bacterium]|nr:type II toxin-antitoxin system prevent-host-death family antitoxin [Deltaproteobacteria bacterium]
MVSKNLGIREVKTNLSGLLKKVKEGQEVIITDRGKPIGKIVPFPAKDLSLENRIRRLEDQGWLEPLPKKAGRRLPPPLPAPGGLAQKYLQEGRNR